MNGSLHYKPPPRTSASCDHGGTQRCCPQDSTDPALQHSESRRRSMKPELWLYARGTAAVVRIRMIRARRIPSSAAPCTWASLLSCGSSWASPSHFAARQQLPLLAGCERHASAATQLKCFQPIACQCSPVGGDPPPFRLPSQTFEFKRPPSTGHATSKASDSSSNLQLVMQPRPATRAAPAASATRCSGND